MVIRGTPDNPQDFYMATDEESFRLQQMGIQPLWFDNGTSFFKKSKRLIKALEKLNIDSKP